MTIIWIVTLIAYAVAAVVASLTAKFNSNGFKVVRCITGYVLVTTTFFAFDDNAALCIIAAAIIIAITAFEVIPLICRHRCKEGLANRIVVSIIGATAFIALWHFLYNVEGHANLFLLVLLVVRALYMLLALIWSYKGNFGCHKIFRAVLAGISVILLIPGTANAWMIGILGGIYAAISIFHIIPWVFDEREEGLPMRICAGVLSALLLGACVLFI